MKFIERVLFTESGSIKPGSKTVIVTGIGGCGKTQLIRKFVESYKGLCVQFG
jgi:DNA transposition AAA+ family ATPase